VERVHGCAWWGLPAVIVERDGDVLAYISPRKIQDILDAASVVVDIRLITHRVGVDLCMLASGRVRTWMESVY
jgi:hypothetical protein